MNELDEKTKMIILRLLQTRKDKGASESECEVVAKWVKDVLIEKSLLDLVLDYKVEINVVDNEVCFKTENED